MPSMQGIINGTANKAIAASRGRDPENLSNRCRCANTRQRLEVRGVKSNTLASVYKDNLVVEYDT